MRRSRCAMNSPTWPSRVERAGASCVLVLAADLARASLERYGLGSGVELGRFPGRALEGLKLNHPWLERQVPVILGEHVTLEAGTGAVHTAPAHGQEDYVVGTSYQLPVVNPVGPDGRFVAGTPLVAGLRVDEADTVLVQELERRGELLRQESLRHSYPHCWRHKTPLIFRATPQWFISMDQQGLRAHALRRHRPRALDAGLGRAAHHGDDRQTVPTGVSRASASGACRWPCSCTSRPRRCIRARRNCCSRWPSASQQRWHRCLVRAGSRRADRRGRGRVRQTRATSWTSGPTRGCRSNAWRPCARTFRRPWTCTWKARTSTAAGFTARC